MEAQKVCGAIHNVCAVGSSASSARDFVNLVEDLMVGAASCTVATTIQ
jgi:hypothetical protein